MTWKAKTRPPIAQAVVQFLGQSAAGSLLDHCERQWRDAFPLPRGKASQQHGLLIYARRQIEDLAYGHGWELEYPRDVWRLRWLGIDDGPVANLKFDRIAQPWLKELAKRWIRGRLASGISSSHASSCTAAITRFGYFLSTLDGDVGLCDLDRGLVQRYLAYLHTTVTGVRDRITHIGALNTFLGDDPPQPLGRGCAASHRDGVQRRLPQATGIGTPIVGRERHGPSRSSGQLGPLQRPELAADHADPHPLRAADHIRYHPAGQLRGHRRRHRTLPALRQPQDETGSTCPHRRRTPPDDQSPSAASPDALARHSPRPVSSTQSQYRRHPPRWSPRLPHRVEPLAARVRRR